MGLNDRPILKSQVFHFLVKSFLLSLEGRCRKDPIFVTRNEMALLRTSKMDTNFCPSILLLQVTPKKVLQQLDTIRAMQNLEKMIRSCYNHIQNKATLGYKVALSNCKCKKKILWKEADYVIFKAESFTHHRMHPACRFLVNSGTWGFFVF